MSVHLCYVTSDDPHADFLRFVCELQEEERLISAAAARNCRRRARRKMFGRGKCWYIGLPYTHEERSRMNPNRTTWGKRR